ncbi:SpoIIE family protein phosphatase [Caldisalinibacter kiritimatiensis]|uniref:Multi-sensor signal transduction histidine kinase n=1 Tax=Caldisalinibacter kiritimatiensis TaxID=1304284 RepID=R1CA92_9FIRM|nr:SpoIIE family protein phosphatase [Caldisalinibacter kiritimatiensis]EOC99254.1 multi-sensor signal transduction histidine kinase [Caldisalinibacter kiritimatiensis]
MGIKLKVFDNEKKVNIIIVLLSLIAPISLYFTKPIIHELISISYIISVVSIKRRRRTGIHSFVYISIILIIFSLSAEKYPTTSLIRSIGLGLFISIYLGSLFEKIDRKRGEIDYYRKFERLITSFSTYFVNLLPEELDDGINYALKEIGEFVDVDRVYIFLLRNDNMIMDNTHEWCKEGIEPQKDMLQDLPSQTFPWWMSKLNNFEHINIKSVDNMPKGAATEKEILKEQDIQSVLVVPISCEGKLLGFFGLDSVTEERQWSEDIISLLKITGQIFGNAIDRSIKYIELAESRDTLKQITDNMTDMVCQVDTKLTYQYISPSFERILGYSSEELIGESIFKGIHPDDVDKIKKAAKEYPIEISEGMLQYRMQRKDGSYIWVESAGKLITDINSNKVIASEFNIRDITKRKVLEDRLKSRMKLEQLIIKMAANFINLSADEIDKGIINSLKKISEFANANHSFIMLISDDDNKMKMEYEWYLKDEYKGRIKKKSIKAQQIPLFIEKMKDKKILKINRDENLSFEEDLREILFLEDTKLLILLSMYSKEKLIGVLGFNIGKLSSCWSDEIIELFQVISDIFVNALERKRYEDVINNYIARLNKSYREIEIAQQKVVQNLEKAKKIHTHFLPDRFPVLKHIVFAADYTPAGNLGGDFYNIIHIDDKVLFYLVDITGHGLDGALLSIFVRETINSYLLSLNNIGEKLTSVKEIVQFIYEQYCHENFPEDYFICICLGLIDTNSMEIRLSNMGLHYPPLVVYNNGKLKRLPKIGLPISNALDREYYDFSNMKEEKIVLEIGDTMFLTTDGLIEEFVSGEIYGEERIKDLLINNYKMPPELIISQVKYDFLKFTGKNQGKDDVTILVIQRKKHPLNSFHNIINNDMDEIYEIRPKIEEFLKFYCNNIEELWIGLMEILINAIEHGNRMRKDKRVEINIDVYEEFIQISVEDEGAGFNWKDIVFTMPPIEFTFSERGRGIMIARKAYDYIWYNNKGNKAFLFKRY